MTYGGGDGLGVIFSFDPSSSTYTRLWDFPPRVDRSAGANPLGSLIQASDGKLYGMTTYGGIYDAHFLGDGTIFSFDPSSSTFISLKSFDNTDGSHPEGSLMQARGKLYGMTNTGGSGAKV